MKKKEMKRMLLCLLFIGVASVSTTDAQEKEKGFMNNVVAEMNFVTNLNKHDINYNNVEILIGYRLLSRLTAFIDTSRPICLEERDNVRNYYVGTNLGGSIAYTLSKLTEEERLELRARVVNSIGHADWKQTVFGGAIQLDCGRWKACRPIIAIRYEYVKSHTASLPDMNLFYASVGFRLPNR